MKISAPGLRVDGRLGKLAALSAAAFALIVFCSVEVGRLAANKVATELLFPRRKGFAAPPGRSTMLYGEEDADSARWHQAMRGGRSYSKKVDGNYIGKRSILPGISSSLQPITLTTWSAPAAAMPSVTTPNYAEMTEGEIHTLTAAQIADARVVLSKESSSTWLAWKKKLTPSQRRELGDYQSAQAKRNEEETRSDRAAGSGGYAEGTTGTTSQSSTAGPTPAMKALMKAMEEKVIKEIKLKEDEAAMRALEEKLAAEATRSNGEYSYAVASLANLLAQAKKKAEDDKSQLASTSSKIKDIESRIDEEPIWFDKMYSRVKGFVGNLTADGTDVDEKVLVPYEDLIWPELGIIGSTDFDLAPAEAVGRDHLEEYTREAEQGTLNEEVSTQQEDAVAGYDSLPLMPGAGLIGSGDFRPPLPR